MTQKKAKITAFSLPQETLNILNNLQNRLHRSRSEILREMIEYYIQSQKKPVKDDKDTLQIEDSDANKVLRLYYQLISETKIKPTIVVGAAIISRKNQVIIGLRKGQDKFVKDLHWTFPSGKFQNLDFEDEVVKTCVRETGLKIRVNQLVHARIYPDSPQKSIRIVVLYYHCKILSRSQKAGGDFKELKWVPAIDVNRYFTTSVS
ncbi:MAG: ribbon-helix-helix protein, CopG family, partial [bacterium]|nr:ribbon-helix-helix protein, CopG family [bacterium]